MFNKTSLVLTAVFLTAALAAAGAWSHLSGGPTEGLAVIAPAAGEAAVPPPDASAPFNVALHKALYDLNMVSVESGAGIAGLKGTMYFEQGDACDAWTTDQRFTMEYQYPERRPVNNTNHYVAWESKDDNRFEFNSERQENGKLTELLRGNVERNADGAAEAKYSRPGGLKFELPKGFLLPTAHTGQIIRRARAGDRIFNATMFDGTDADGPVSVTVFIGKKVTPDEMKALLPAKGVDAALLSGDAWRIRMAVFPLKDKDGLLPAYEMNMILHANGVISYALVDYRTFKVEQKLRTIEKVADPKCQ
jgi:hypothetical protein